MLCLQLRNLQSRRTRLTLTGKGPFRAIYGSGEQGADCSGGFRKGQAHSMSWLGQPQLEGSSWEPQGEPEPMGNSASYQATEEEGYFIRRQEAERGC